MTEQQRDDLFLAMFQSMNKKDELMTEMYHEMTEMRKEMKSEMKEIRTEMKEMRTEMKDMRTEMAEMKHEIKANTEAINELREQTKANTEAIKENRRGLAKLEVTLSDKIDILFDVREINSEKFKKQDEEISSIKRTLKNHYSEIMHLKSKIV